MRDGAGAAPLRTEPRVFGRPAIWGWMSFDFAAQPFFTIVVTFIFGPYFVSQLAPDPATGQTYWAAAATVSSLCVGLLAPLLGAIADRAGPRKPWIAAFALVKIGALLMLWTAAPNSSLFAAAALIVLATVAAEFSIVFNDAMLPHLVPKRSTGLVSNVAWGIGYCAGMISLFATVLLFAADAASGLTLAGIPPLFGLDPGQGEAARATGPFSAIWYLVFVLPMFLLVPDRPPRPVVARSAVREGVAELLGTVREVRRRGALFRFILARLFYQDGVNGILLMGGAFAAGLFGWSVTESGLFGIVLNVFAILGCGIAGLIDRRFGSKSVVMASIVCLGIASIGIASTSPNSTLFGLLVFADPTGATGLFPTGAERSYLAFGILIGLAFGPIQASSRSWLAQSVEADEAGRYFGLYAMTGRVTTFLAPLSVALLTAFAATHTDPVTAARIGMSALLAFFLIGFLLLLTTRDPRRDGAD